MKKTSIEKIFALTLSLSVALTGSFTLQLIGNRKAAIAAASSDGRQLILDAGHGGEDGGAVSLTGVSESGLNLAITLKLDRLLGFYGEAPILLREEDISLHDPGADTLRKKKISDLHNRVAAVESEENAFVLSIHQNHFSNPVYHGAQTFYRRDPLSCALAEQIQETLRRGIDPGNCRSPAVIPDSVYFMKHITCPAVLIECGFLSNPAEEEKLRSDEYQIHLAMCLASAWLRSGEIRGGTDGRIVL